MIQVDKKEFQKLVANDLANTILYNMCKNYPLLLDKAQLVAKTFLIGRSYAVSPQRGVPKPNDGMNYHFFDHYTENLISELKVNNHNLDIDINIRNLNNIKTVNIASIILGLKLIILFNEASYKSIIALGGNNNSISFSTKLLHFHLPNHIYIKDSYSFINAKKTISNSTKNQVKNDFIKITDQLKTDKLYDEKYNDLIYHTIRCFYISNQAGLNGYVLSPRDVDNYLIRKKIATQYMSIFVFD